MKIGPSSGKPHAAIVAEASAWFIEFRAGDANGEARLGFIDWLRRSPEHIQAYLEVSDVWAELPTSDPHGKIDISSLIARARSEIDVIELSLARVFLILRSRPSRISSRIHGGRSSGERRSQWLLSRCLLRSRSDSGAAVI
jgi:ferric-dicitrate binding protein FerR (iron transport regulator)